MAIVERPTDTSAATYDAELLVYQNIIKAIRFRVNNAYDETDLPDATIENRFCLGEANKKIAEYLPNWASLNTALLDRLKDAVIYQAAIEILYSEGRIAAEDTEGEAVARYEQLDTEDLIAFYTSNIRKIITDIKDEIEDEDIFSISGGVFESINPTKRF